MWNLRWLCWIAFSIFGVACLAQVCSSDERKLPTTARAEDLCNGNCIILGRLGKPYGKISKVRAIWEAGDLSKPSPPRLRITHIDGRRLADSQQILVNGIDVKWLREKPDSKETRRIGHVVEGRAYESGGYPGSEWPPQVRETLGLPPVQPLYGFAFHSFLYFID